MELLFAGESEPSSAQLSQSHYSPKESPLQSSPASPTRQPSLSQLSPSPLSLPVDLHELISTEQYHKLEEFSTHSNQKEEKSLCLGECVFKALTKLMPSYLGIHEDKEARTVLHEAVKRTFPNIVTYTARNAAVQYILASSALSMINLFISRVRPKYLLRCIVPINLSAYCLEL